eukprot:TRINITY_DN3589_c0_g1_i2.p1 TRINITY_DN3589_c0_g1~~TRINITY_DN3589_c0_g1_i2.p1  ORF type:complete len:204 (-),score=20.98 TRINITY_DN3589_c0_g1_i2:20-631(-)
MKARLASLFRGRTIVYLDLEYISEGLKQHARPTASQWKEVVQFGAVKFDHSLGKEIGKFNCFTKPTVFQSQMDDKDWEYFYDVTALDRDTLMKGTDFMDAFAEFQKFQDKLPVVIMLGDQDVLTYNFTALNVDVPKMEYTKLKPLLCEFSEKYENLCSSDLHKDVGLIAKDIVPDNESVRAHDGLFDARSMAWFVQKNLEDQK